MKYRGSRLFTGMAGLLICMVIMPLQGVMANKYDPTHRERTANKPTGWWWYRNVSESQVNAYLKKHRARLIDIQVVKTSPYRFNVAMVSNSGLYRSGWWWHYGKTEKQIIALTKKLKARIIDIEKYRVKGKTRFAAVMVHNRGSYGSAWWWYHGKTAAQVNALVKKYKARLIDVDVERIKPLRFSVVMVKNTGKNRRGWWWYYGKSAKTLNALLKKKRARLVDVEQYRAGGQVYAAIMTSNTGSASSHWWWYTNLTSSQLAHLSVRHSARIIDIESHRKGGKHLYHVAMIDNGVRMTGKAVPAMRVFDRLVIAYMRKHAVPGVSLAVVKNKKLVYARGYGYANIKKQQLVHPNHQFRLASISKPITYSAILQLEKAKKLKRTDKIMKYLGGVLKGIKLKDKNVRKITIQNLIDHKAGWVNDKLGLSPMFSSDKIAKAMKTKRPTSCRTIIRYIVKYKKLAHKPGEDGGFDGKKRYSNFSYCVLGRIIEKASGRSYESYVRRYVLKPAGSYNMRTGRTRYKHRYPKEVTYYDKIFPGLAKSVFPGKPKKVPWQYGGYYLEAMDAHGGWIASAPQLARYAIGPTKSGWSFSGAFAGSVTRLSILDKGVVVVMLSNTGYSDAQVKDMANLVKKAADRVKRWPRLNLFPKYRF